MMIVVIATGLVVAAKLEKTIAAAPSAPVNIAAIATAHSSDYDR
jgi:hypothetical protein